ncbi:hypothetical protein PFISCL1PPCAC_13292, partial [Pristionchus fissidentatus]
DPALIAGRNDLLVANRYHEIIVYKTSPIKGYIGFAARLGSVHIVAEILMSDSRRVEIGDFIRTRVELNKQTGAYVVEKVVEVCQPQLKTQIQGEQLLIGLDRWEIGDVKPVVQGNSRFDGFLEHPQFLRILCSKKQIEQWRGKTVNAVVRHAVGMSEENPMGIYLVLHKILGEYDEQAQREDFPKAEEVESRGGAMTESNGGYGGDEWTKGRGEGEERGGGVSASGGYESSNSFRGSESGRGGGGRGKQNDRRPARGNRSTNYGRRHPSDSPEWSGEGSGFGYAQRPMEEKTNVTADRGLIVFYCGRFSVIYTQDHKLVEYDGNLGVGYRFFLGDTVDFEMAPSDDTNLRYKVMRGTPKLSHDKMRIKTHVYGDELFVHTRGRLRRDRNFFETKDVSDVRIDRGMREKIRGCTDYNAEYVVCVTFSTDKWCWMFAGMDDQPALNETEEEEEE